ncbi:MAG: RluA family pseudouridine synthase [Candidatus Woesearchaeota archaeon]
MKLNRENKFVVNENIKLVNFLSQHCPYLENKFLDLFKENRIKVNGKFVFEDVELSVGDFIIIVTPRELEPKVNTEFEIIYEDEWFFAVNKSAPLPVHPAGKYYFNTLTNLLIEKGVGDFYPVNRLDRETTGIVIFAKNKEMATKLGNLFSKNNVKKKYLAVCFGKMKEKNFVVDEPLLKKEFKEIRNHVVVDVEGKKCETEFNVLKSNDKFSLVEVKPKTGRSHQIRVHLAYIEHPIVGDKQYGIDESIFSRFSKENISDEEILKKVLTLNHLLHCFEIEFVHPVTKEIVKICAEMSKDMKTFINKNF